MPLLVTGLLLFFGTHLFTTARAPRAALVARLGENGFKGLYSLVALVGMVLIGQGYGAYRSSGWTEIWSPPIWTSHLSLLLNLPIFTLFIATYAGGRIKQMVKHPMLLAVKIWATAHLIANGDLGSVLLFGGFLVWAVIARISLKRRPEEIARLANEPRVPFGRGDYISIGGGLALYVATVVWLHPLLIGVAIWPGRPM